MLAPVLPAYAQSLGASATLVGLLLASFGVTRLFVSLPASWLAGRVGHRRLLVGSPLITAPAAALCAAAGGFWVLALFCIVEGAAAPPWMTILHNCDCHTFDQVVKQLQKAIGRSEAEGWDIAWSVHKTGKAVVRIGPEPECVRVGNILAAIGLVVTVVQS